MAQTPRTSTPAKTRSASTVSETVFVALGGLGEVGMNCYVYGTGKPAERRYVLIDIGITFPDHTREPGVDVILPDLKFLTDNLSALEGVVITHAHEDHYGALLDLWGSLGVPVYATPFTNALVKAKSAEFGGRGKPRITEIPVDQPFEVGPFKLEYVTMMHSIPETQGLVISTPEGRFFHTADWKIEDNPVSGQPTDRARLAKIGADGIDAIICDSTNALRDGRSPSETEVASSIAKIIARAPRRVAVTLFSSNVARIQAVAEAAQKAGRQLVVAGRAIHRMVEVAIETGHLPKGFRYYDQTHFGFVPPHDCVLLLTGSQGEQRAALARIAERSHPEIKLDAGDMVIFSSRTIPGNEKLVGHIQNRLIDQGCEIITDQDALVHVTGHPRREELKEMYGLIKPRIAIPMHGESRHLKAHADLAKAAGVPQVITVRNGDIVKLAPGRAEVIDEAHTGRIFRDGRLLIPETEGSVRERRRLAEAGIAVVALAMTDRGATAADPEIILDGIPYEDDDGRDMEEVVLDAIEGTLKSIPPKRRGDMNVIEDAVRRAVRSAIDQAWGKKPIVKVIVQVVGGRK